MENSDFSFDGVVDFLDQFSLFYGGWDRVLGDGEFSADGRFLAVFDHVVRREANSMPCG